MTFETDSKIGTDCDRLRHDRCGGGFGFSEGGRNTRDDFRRSGFHAQRWLRNWLSGVQLIEQGSEGPRRRLLLVSLGLGMGRYLVFLVRILVCVAVILLRVG